jgi:tRNA (cmo5U34)-methyltransferase
MKSTPDQIRQRFDNDVERFSNLDTGQVATIDARLCMELVTEAAALVTPSARDLLDIGAGAGNYSLMMLKRLPSLNCTLIDLSRPMLDRAAARIHEASTRTPKTLQGDMRELTLGENNFDIVLAAATLHHLRTDAEWQTMFAKIHKALRPGGSFWIFDMTSHDTPAIEKMMKARHGDYLAALKGGGQAGETYRNHVFAYIDEEDTPRSLNFQLKTLEATGFKNPEVLHKNAYFAAFGAQK